jgi:hypothetical protein
VLTASQHSLEVFHDACVAAPALTLRHSRGYHNSGRRIPGIGRGIVEQVFVQHLLSETSKDEDEYCGSWGIPLGEHLFHRIEVISW